MSSTRRPGSSLVGALHLWGLHRPQVISVNTELDSWIPSWCPQRNGELLGEEKLICLASEVLRMKTVYSLDFLIGFSFCQ